MAAVPGDEVGRREAAGELLTVDAEPAVDGRAVREDDGVVVLVQLLDRQVYADLDVAEEADAVGLEHLAQRQGDRLDLAVVRRDAVANQPVRAGQPVDDVDLDPADVRGGLDQRLRGIDARRTTADNCDSKHLQWISRDAAVSPEFAQGSARVQVLEVTPTEGDQRCGGVPWASGESAISAPNFSVSPSW